jgi:hypothetical protein
VLTQLCGSLTAGIILSQALYWSQITCDPDMWFYKTSADWERETTLTERQQSTARSVLRRFPFWDEKRKGVNGTLHYRVHYQELLLALRDQARSDETANLQPTRAQDRDGTNRRSRYRISSKPNKEAENTSENTSEMMTQITSISPTPLFDQTESTKAFPDGESSDSSGEKRNEEDSPLEVETLVDALCRKMAFPSIDLDQRRALLKKQANLLLKRLT